jgi:hypothetical protein
MMLKRQFQLLLVACLLVVAHDAVALTLDVTTGTTGTEKLNQSFNDETRGVDVVVLGGDNLLLTSMTLTRVDTFFDPASVTALVFTDTGTLLTSGSASVPSGTELDVTIPVSATLTAGDTFRVAFYLTSGEGDVFDPDPLTAAGFSYTESQGLLQVTGAFLGSGSGFPTGVNGGVPFMSLEVTVPEPTAPVLLTVGLLAGITVRRRRATRTALHACQG